MSKQKQAVKSVKSSKKKVKDAEISAEQVVREEIFPSKERAEKRRRCSENCGCGCSEKHDDKSKSTKSSSCSSSKNSEICGCKCTDNPSVPKKNAKAYKTAGKAPAKSVAPKGERVKQKGYKMIDPSDTSADGGKS